MNTPYRAEGSFHPRSGRRIARSLGLLLALSLLAAGGARAQEFLFTADFQGLREGARPVGWVVVPPLDANLFWIATNGQFYTGNGDDILSQTESYAIIEHPNALTWSNYVLRCSFWMKQSVGEVLLVTRWQDVNNYYLLVLSSGATSSDAPFARLVKVAAGQRVTLAEVTHGRGGVRIPTFVKGDSVVDSHQLAFEATGDQLRVSIDGTLLLEARDGAFKQGSCGLGQRINEVYFDKVYVISTRAAEGAAPTAAVPGAPVSAGPGAFFPTGPALPTGDVYRILVMDGLEEAAARELRSRMLEEGFFQVEALPSSGGKFGVYLGMFLSQQEAEQQRSFLVEEQGVPSVGVVKVSGAQAQEVIRTAETLATGERLRVQVIDVNDSNQATGIKRDLESNGYFPVEINFTGSTYQVFCGPPFESRTDAEELANTLRQGGYFAAEVIRVSAREVAVAAPVAGAPSLEEIRRAAEQSGHQASEQELAAAQRIIEQRQMMMGGAISFEDYQALVNLIKQQDQKITGIINTVEQSRAEQMEKEKAIKSIKSAVDQAVDAGQYDKALELLGKWEQLDPTNPGIEFKRRIVESRKTGGMLDEEGYQKRVASEMESKIQLARDAENNGNYQHALLLWTDIRASARGAKYDEATQAVRRLETLLAEQRKAQQTAAAPSQTLFIVLFFGGVLLVVALTIFLLVMMARSRKRDQALLAQVQATLQPMREIEEGEEPKMLEAHGPEPVEEAPPAPAPPPPPARPKRAEPIAMAEEAPAPPPAPAAPKAAPAVFEMPDISAAPPARAAAPAPPEPAAASPAMVGDPFAVSAPAPAQASAKAPAAPAPPPAAPPARPMEEVPLAHAPAPPVFEEQEVLAGAPSEAFGLPSDSESSSIPLLDLPDVIHAEPPSAKGAASPDALAMLSTSTTPLPKAPEPAAPPAPARPAAPAAPAAGFTRRAEIGPSEGTLPLPGTEEQAPVPGLSDLPTILAPEEPTVLEAEATAAPKAAAPAPKAQPVSAPSMAPTPILPPAGTDRGKKDIIFQQDFDDEPEGAVPKNWRGEYDYASIVISSQTPAPGSTRCLRFEKRTGSGSAYYACRFPEVGGLICVEFDLRCDDKNKYLLGVYVEKDEDFRQSVHTIVHRTSPQVSPTLRIQGEPTSYTLGSWRHLKYEIDLNANRVNGYIDGELVANGVPLASPPKSINTLSIRDNLATTGILLLDNIVIYRI